MRWTIDLDVERPIFLMEITAQLTARTLALAALVESDALPKAAAEKLLRLASREAEYLSQVFEQHAESGVTHPPAAGPWCPAVAHIERIQEGWYLLSATRDRLGKVFELDHKPGLIAAIEAMAPAGIFQHGARKSTQEPAIVPEPGTFKCTPQKEP